MVRNMVHEVRLHPHVTKFLDSLNEKERKRCLTSLNTLKDNPFESRPGTDIKKLKGKLHTLYRLRVGDNRFEYFIENSVVWIVKAFLRGAGYSN
jgi:mRNA-degrading endonuclease RelE of RelBE toxin-antitoxin system